MGEEREYIWDAFEEERAPKERSTKYTYVNRFLFPPRLPPSLDGGYYLEDNETMDTVKNEICETMSFEELPFRWHVMLAYPKVNNLNFDKYMKQLAFEENKGSDAQNIKHYDKLIKESNRN